MLRAERKSYISFCVCSPFSWVRMSYGARETLANTHTIAHTRDGVCVLCILPDSQWVVPECDHPVQGRGEFVGHIHPSALAPGILYVRERVWFCVCACTCAPVYLCVCVFESACVLDRHWRQSTQTQHGGGPFGWSGAICARTEAGLEIQLV